MNLISGGDKKRGYVKEAVDTWTSWPKSSRKSIGSDSFCNQFARIFLLFLCFQSIAQEQGKSIKLEWNFNNDIRNLDGFRMHWGTESQRYTTHIDILKDGLGGLQNNVEIKGFIAQTTYYFAVTAFNKSGESPHSNEVRWTAPKIIGKMFQLSTNIQPDPGGLTSKVTFKIEGGEPDKNARLLASFDLRTWIDFSQVRLDANGEATLEAELNQQRRMFFKAEIVKKNR